MTPRPRRAISTPKACAQRNAPMSPTTRSLFQASREKFSRRGHSQIDQHQPPAHARNRLRMLPPEQAGAANNHNHTASQIEPLRETRRHHCPHIWPPSTTTQTPMTNEARVEKRKTTKSAIS